MFQVSIKADALPRSPAALAASAQVFAQPAPHEVIELPKRLARIAQLEIVGPPSQVPIHAPNQFRQGCVALLRIDELPQRLPFPRHRFAGWLEIEVAAGSSVILVSVIPQFATIPQIDGAGDRKSRRLK